MIRKKEIGMLTYSNYKEDIVKSQTLYYKMKKEIENYTKLSELTYKDYINTVVHCVDYFNFYMCGIADAQKWLSMKNEKLDKRKKYEEEYSFNKFEEFLQNELFDNHSFIINISSFGYENYAWIIEFKHFDDVFELYIPCLDKINEKNFDYTYQGQLALGIKTGDSNWELFAFSYEEQEIADEFKKYLDSKKKN